MTVDLELLMLALEEHSPGMAWVLDRRTGEVIPVIDPKVTGEEETKALVDADPARYLPIEPMPSRESFEIMEDFVERVAPPAIRDRLEERLRRRHPFREFKSALFLYPEVREAWFRFHCEQMTSVARRWLAEAGVDDVIHGADRPRGS